MSQSPKSKFVLYIVPYLNAAFFLVQHFKVDFRQPHLARFLSKGTNRRRKQHSQKYMDYDPYRDVPCILCFSGSLLSRAIRKLHDESPGIDTMLRRKSENPNKHGQNTVFPVFFFNITTD